MMQRGHGWHSRGYLPHYDPGHATQFVTWRLADSIPAELYLRWKAELTDRPADKRELYRRVEDRLDAGTGSCVLLEPTRAKIVETALLHHVGSKCEVHAYVVMPNHVHLLLTPFDGVKLGQLLHSIKGFSGREINKVFRGSGRLWQPDYYDRFIRDEEHFMRVRKYIERNPVKASLCVDPREWVYSSASSKHLREFAS